jgi:hypothetical protein
MATTVIIFGRTRSTAPILVDNPATLYGFQRNDEGALGVSLDRRTSCQIVKQYDYSAAIFRAIKAAASKRSQKRMAHIIRE